jgi:plastocyanin
MQIKTLARPQLFVAAFAVAAVVVLAACGSSSSSSSPATTPASSPAAGGGSTATTNAIVIQNFAFAPAKTTVKAGTAVTWTNNDSTPHDVTSTNGPGTGATVTSLFTSGELAQGKTFSFTFKKAGTYYYECKIHASLGTMHAVVIVK